MKITQIIQILTISSAMALPGMAHAANSKTSKHTTSSGASAGRSVTQGNTTKHYSSSGASAGKSVTQGNTTRHTDASGKNVGRSTTQAVVAASILILVFDLFLTRIILAYTV